MTQEQWERIRLNLMDWVGQGNYKSWIEPLEYIGLRNGVARFRTGTGFEKNYVSQNFGEKILRVLMENGQPVREVVTEEGGKSGGMTTGSQTPFTTKRGIDGQVEEAGSGLGERQKLNPRFVFDDFVVGKPNEMAYVAARQVSENLAPSGVLNPLLFYGGVGLGKTHLMHAIAHSLLTRRPDINLLYLSAEQFMFRFVNALRERSIMDFKHFFRALEVLIVDDIQFIAGKDSTQEEFFHTFNALVDQDKQVILSADRVPGEIKGLEARIQSRLQSSMVVNLHPTDFELRLAILQSKAARKCADSPTLRIEDGVLEFLADSISTNVRELDGALKRLFVFAEMVEQPITMALTQDCLADTLRSARRKITIEEVQQKIAEYYHISLSELIGPRKLKIYAHPRQVAMYLCKELTTQSLLDIARNFGGRDHSTVMYGVRRVEALKQKDDRVNEDVEKLRRSLES